MIDYKVRRNRDETTFQREALDDLEAAVEDMATLERLVETYDHPNPDRTPSRDAEQGRIVRLRAEMQAICDRWGIERRR